MSNKHNSRSVNKHVLVEDLGLKQVSNSLAFTNGSLFVLSPSMQNQSNWFDIRKPNIDRYQEKSYKGFLIIRFFNTFLATELTPFITKMMPEDKFVFNKDIGPHWKFNIIVTGNTYSIINQQDSKTPYPIKEYSKQDLQNFIRL